MIVLRGKKATDIEKLGRLYHIYFSILNGTYKH
jgi:hypothetical protein